MSKIKTVPNQQIVKVHRESMGKNFISISKENYSKAYRDMSSSSSALGLYIWFVGNKDNYTFALSPQAIENQLGMARSSCHGAIKKLIELGYLVKKDEKSNVYDFYEITRLEGKIDRKPVESEMLIFEDDTSEDTACAKKCEFDF